MKISNRISPFYIFIAGLIVGLGLVGSLLVPNAQAAGKGERLIMIHDRGRDHGLITKAGTLREVLAEARIKLDKNDRVEPGLDEPLVTNNYQVNIYRARPIVIVDGNVKQLVMSAYQTPKQIAKHAGIELHDEDQASVEVSNNFVSDGASIRMTIDRALPVQLKLYGKVGTVYTQATTVGEFLREKSISLGKNDDMSVTAGTPITANMALGIWRNGKQMMTQEEPVPFETERVMDANRDVGFKQVDTPGVNGTKMVTYEVIMQDGQEVSRTAIQAIVTKAATKQVETIGTKKKGGTPAQNRILGKAMMLEAGFGEDQWPCLDNLWTRESGWDQYKSNYSGSGAYGIPQALPGSKMGAGWQDDPVTQIRWGLGYIKGRYGTPCGAWATFLRQHWY